MDPISLIIGIGLGSFITFLALRNRSTEVTPRDVEIELAQLREKSSLVESLKAELSENLCSSQNTQNELSRIQATFTEKQKSFESTSLKLNESEDLLKSLLAENSGLRTQIDAEKKHQKEKLAILQTNKEELTLSFKELANKIFTEQNKNYSENNKEKLDALLKPLQTQITDFSKKVQDCYETEAKERFSLKNEIVNLQKLNTKMSEDAHNLTRALKGDSKAQGSWGEVILERILEASGLTKDREYQTQVHSVSEEGKLFHPDVIIKLPDDKDVIIDSKVSLTAYEQFCSSDDLELQAGFRKAHLNSVKNHIKELSDKSYENLPEINSLDYVLLFMPVEGAFRLAVESDENLFLDAYKKNIMLVSPSTLLITLRTIHKIWQYEYQNQHAHAIAAKAEALYGKFVGYIENFQKVGKALDVARKSYDAAEGQLHTGKGNIIRTCQSLEELGIKSKKQIPRDLTQKAELQLNLDNETTSEDE